MPDDADMRRQKQVQNLDFALGELRRSLEFYQSQIMGYHSNDLSLNAVHVFLQNNVIGSRDDAVGRLNQLLAREGFGSNVAHADNYPRHAAFGSQHPQPGYEVACGAAMHGLNSDRTDYFTAEPAYRPHGNRGIVKSAMLALAGKLIQWSK
jgi:hypothetical protein